MKIKDNSTIAEIALECGVSSMTVSRALRRNALVKAETREKIIRIAESMGYIKSPRLGNGAEKPNAPKVQLIAGTSGKGMALFHTQIITSIEQSLSSRNYECVIRICSGDYSIFLTLLENMGQFEDVPVIIIGSFPPEQLRALLEAAPGATLVDNPGDTSIDTPYSSFAFDNAEAGRIGTRHLLDCGRKHILLAGGSEGHFFTQELEQGYRDALTSRNIKVDDRLIFRTDFTADNAREEVSSALDNGLKFDAVLTNDEMASGVYRALLDRGLKIPKDVSVCGCDGLPVGSHLYPRLTTIDLDYSELGKMAVRHLLDSKNIPVCRTRLLPKLEIRESSVR